MRKILFVSLLLFAVLVIPVKSSALTDKGYRSLHTFSEVLHQVEESYVEEVDERKLIQGAIRGMLTTLDPHTVYMPTEVYKDLKIEATGRFGGVGIEVTILKGVLTIVSPVQGSPAQKAGIKPGDKIVRIDGWSTKGMDLGEAVQIIRGKTGRRVTITVMRKGSNHPIDFHLVRRVIKVPSVVEEDLGDGYGYIRINTFQERTTHEMKKKLKKLAGDGELKGIIIDMRNNPGGLLGQSIEVADLFLDKGVIVSTKSKNREVSRYDATPADNTPKYPIVVMLNGGSASASEILAGALKDHGKALTVGTQSFGKGSVQSVIELDDGSALKITVAKYYTPSGVSIQGSGITPNVIIEEEDDVNAKTDIQKEVAISYLKDRSKYKKALKGSRKYRK